MNSTCPECSGPCVPHCQSPSCTWKRCVKCRGYGEVGRLWADFAPTVQLETLMIAPTRSDEERIPPLPTSD